MYDLMDGIAAGTSPVPTFEDGYRCQAVLDTLERSAESREWTRPEYGGSNAGCPARDGLEQVPTREE